MPVLPTWLHAPSSGSTQRAKKTKVAMLECARCEGRVAAPGNTLGQAAAHAVRRECREAQTRDWCGKNRVQPTALTPNLLCRACIRNGTHTFVEFGEDCVECSKVRPRNIRLVLVGVFVCVLWLSWMASANVSQPLFKIVVYFMQVLGLVLGPTHD